MATMIVFKWGMSLVRTNKGIKRFKPGTKHRAYVSNNGGEYVDVEFEDDNSTAQNILAIAVDSIEDNTN
jgi:hypothetical protein